MRRSSQTKYLLFALGDQADDCTQAVFRRKILAENPKRSGWASTYFLFVSAFIRVVSQSHNIVNLYHHMFGSLFEADPRPAEPTILSRRTSHIKSIYEPHREPLCVRTSMILKVLGEVQSCHSFLATQALISRLVSALNVLVISCLELARVAGANEQPG